MRSDHEWECVEPSSLERFEAGDDPKVCPIGKVPTPSPNMPLRHRLSLGMKAIASFFRYIADLRRMRHKPGVD